MRKIIFVIWGLLLMASSAGAAEIGDVVGETYHTDIAAYVNNYSIPSYAANGTSVIVAEDLRACGFDVSWNDAERSLTITRNPDLKPVGMVVRKNGAAGIRFMDILYTDIKVFANGIQVPSYAIQGYTVVPLESLTTLGKCEWRSEERAIHLWVDGMDIKPEKQPVYQRRFTENMNIDTDSEDVRYFDFDFDGLFESFSVNISNRENIELLINGKSFVTENAFETGIRKVFVTDIDQADRALDIIVVTSFKNPGIRVYQYRNGELVKSRLGDVDDVFILNGVSKITDSVMLKVYTMPSETGNVGFYIYTTGEPETVNEQNSDGNVMHVFFAEKRHCFEKVSTDKYVVVDEEKWNF